MEKLHFGMESLPNFIKFCCAIIFENGNKLKELGGVWHKVFDGDNGDKLFQGFMEELFPNGGTIGIEELTQFTNKAIRFLETDISCLDIKAESDRQLLSSYVYFAPMHKVFVCGFAMHEDMVIQILVDFFGKSIMDFKTEQLRQFIINSFEIRSQNSSMRVIANDAAYIQKEVYRRSSIKK